MKYTVRVCYRPGEWQELGQHLTMKLVESAVGAFLRDMESLEGKGQGYSGCSGGVIEWR